MGRVKVGARWVGEGEPCFVVAELSGNHGQSFERAVDLVRAAKEIGADAVKTQTYRPDTLTIDCDEPWFRIAPPSPWAGKTLFDLYREAYTPWEWQPRLQEVARELGMEFFSSPFDATAVDLLESMDVPAYKIASFENADLELLRRVAATRKPVFISGGMASLGELDEAVRTLRRGGATDIVLLKCTSAYPAPLEEMNLRTIPHLAVTFDVTVGLSDHSHGPAAAVAAVALGASVVEKHLILTRSEGGPDCAFSMEPSEFAEMVRLIRQTERALGRVSYERTPTEQEGLVFRRSLFVVEDVEAGEVFTAHNVRSIRPGHGLAPRFLPDVLGRRATRAIRRGAPLTWELVGPRAEHAATP